MASQKMHCLLVMFAVSHVQALANIATPDAPVVAYSPARHDAAIWQYKNGEPDAALSLLSAWLAGDVRQQITAAQRVRILSDYVALLQAQGRPVSAIEAAQSLPLEQLPEYALDALFGAARAVRQVHLEAAVVQVLMQRPPVSLDTRLKQIYWLIDTAQLQAAETALPALYQMADDDVQTVRVLEAEAFLAEAREKWISAVEVYAKALLLAPHRKDLQRQRLFLLSRAGAATFALKEARVENAAAKPLFSERDMRQLEQRAISEELKWALRDRDVFGDGRRFIALTKVLRKIERLRENLAAVPLTDALRFSLDNDYLVALVGRGRNQEAIALFRERQRQGTAFPYYVLAAVADACAQERDSIQAVELYEHALREAGNNLHMPSDVHIGLFYAYLDTGRFGAAERLLVALEAATPLHNNLGKPNAEYLAIQSLQARYLLYTERDKLALDRFEILHDSAPFNEDFSIGLAQALGQRGKTEASLTLLEAILTDRPASLDARGSYASALLAANRIREGRDLVAQLQLEFPEASMVRRLVRSSAALQGASVEIESSAGRSSGSSRLVSSEQRIAVRGNSMLFDDQWRVYAQKIVTRASTDQGKLIRQRSEAGISWLNERWSLAGGIHRTEQTGSAIGVTATLNYRLDDQWRWSGIVDSNSSTLSSKAYADGVHGREYSTGIGYVVSESRQFDGNYQQIDFSDGNRRHAFSLSWSERWYSGPRAQFSTTLSMAATRNGVHPAAYFNPRTDTSIEQVSRYQWLTWKRDERRLTQRFYGTLGWYLQAGYGARPLWGIRYEHEWQLGERLALSYGVGLAAHPYDGVGDRRSYGYVNLSVPFD